MWSNRRSLARVPDMTSLATNPFLISIGMVTDGRREGAFCTFLKKDENCVAQNRNTSSSA
jgi:hypothetical protein